MEISEGDALARVKNYTSGSNYRIELRPIEVEVGDLGTTVVNMRGVSFDSTSPGVVSWMSLGMIEKALAPVQSKTKKRKK